MKVSVDNEPMPSSLNVEKFDVVRSRNAVERKLSWIMPFMVATLYNFSASRSVQAATTGLDLA